VPFAAGSTADRTPFDHVKKEIFLTRFLTATAALACIALPAAAQDHETCRLLPGATSAGISYEQIGPAACEQFSRDTEGCTAWSCTLHNFNPDSGPGECRTLTDVSDDEASDRDFCGFLDENDNA